MTPARQGYMTEIDRLMNNIYIHLDVTKYQLDMWSPLSRSGTSSPRIPASRSCHAILPFPICQPGVHERDHLSVNLADFRRLLEQIGETIFIVVVHTA